MLQGKADSNSALQKRIESAFPVELRLAENEICSGRDCDHLLGVIRGREWPELSPTQVRHLTDGVHDFSDRGFNYFLPAYMRAALIDRNEADLAVTFTAWAYLRYAPDAQPHRDPGLLTCDQRLVLFDWLQWYIDWRKDELSHHRQAVLERAFQEEEALKEMFKEDVEEIERYEADLAQLKAKYPTM